jgi:N-acetylmuramoyl-L-alanine amidase
MKETILLVDAGHGGLDPITGEYKTPPNYGKKFNFKTGTYHNNSSWFYEGYSNRVIASEFIAQASRAGFICVPVFQPSEDTSLMRRINLANQYYKEVNKNCIFLSFHSNAFKSYHRGLQAYHYPNSLKGKAIAKAIIATTQKTFINYDSIEAYPLRTAKFAVLRATIPPAVLLELGFFDNREDADLLIDSEFRADIVASIVAGLNNIL